MNLGKAILRVLRVFGIIILIPVVLVLLALLIGFITDLSVTPRWKQAQQESQDYFAKIKTQRYSSGASFATLDANAWDYYDRAAKPLDSLSGEDKRAMMTLTSSGDSFDLKLALRLIQSYTPALALLDSGAACAYCAIPYEYEQGPMMPIPKYISLQNLGKLGLIQGRAEMAQGKPRAAANSYAKVMKLGADIAGGGELFIGRMVGYSLLKLASMQVSGNLGQLDLESVLFLKETATRLEDSWPPMSSSLETECRFFFLPAVNDFDMLNLMASYVSNRSPNIIDRVVGRIFLSVLSWKHGFSMRRVLLEVEAKQMGFVQSYRVLENKPWAAVSPAIEQWETEQGKKSSLKELSDLFPPFNPRVLRRAFAYRLCFRVLKAALVVRENRLSRKKSPMPLDSLLAEDPGMRDLADDRPLYYKIKPDGRTLRLYSVGMNLRDDQGEGLELDWKGDQDKDDIWIEVP